MTNEELKDIIRELVGNDEEIFKDISIFEGDEFADGAVGLTNDHRVVYDYDMLVLSLMEHNGWTQEEAVEWLDYNTLGSLGSMPGKSPIMMMNRFEDWR